MEHAKQVAAMLEEPSLPVILADNVADYYFKDTGQEDWNIPQHFPNIAPPFTQFWVEHRMPTVIHSDKHGDTETHMVNGRVGVLVTAAGPDQVKAVGGPIHPDTKWILMFELFLDYGRARPGIEGPQGSMFMQVDATGVLLERPWMQSFHGPGTPNEVMQSLITWTYPVLLTMTFLHCKNVSMVDNRVEKPLAKKWHTKTGQWPTQYKTLIIEPRKQILRTKGGSGQNGLAKAMHICRGHFADYTEGRGLFGKYHGKFWIPQTIRGSKKDADAPAREIVVKL